VGKLPSGVYYVLDEVDFALRASVARELSPADTNRHAVDKTRLHALHPAIRDVVGGHKSAAAWLEGTPLPSRVKTTGTDVPLPARVLKAKLHPGQDAAKVIQQLRKHPDVEGAGLNILHEPAYVPNDPLWFDQWAPFRVRADEAWDVPEVGGQYAVRVAIVDTGVDLTHPDLASRIVYNRGYNGNPNGDAKRDMRGGASIDHGTHVAGIVAAIRDNNIGVAGITRANIMAMGCAAWNSDKNAYYIDSAADAIFDAVDDYADIINCSFGMGWWNYTTIDDHWTPQIALNHAEDNGVIVVAAAGNETNNVDNSTSAGWNRHDWPLIVSSTERDNSLSGFSNFGSAIDLAAPGGEILSTVTTNYVAANANGTYYAMWGTSQASPCVAGAAARVLAAQPRVMWGPGVKDLLFRMAKDLLPTGKDSMYGYGLVQLNPQFLKLVNQAAAFVGPNSSSHLGNYHQPYTTINEAISHISAGGTLVLNGGGQMLAEYHYPAQSINSPVTLAAFPDRPVIIGR
jgi:thermitase